ncbi:MAG: MFS transporter, partial [Firmicutes bacterium]|nr:MFS transporter [Bacillota bacterium]
GVNGFVLRLSVSVEALAVYLVFHLTGFHANAAQIASPIVKDGMRVLLSGLPLVALAVSAQILRKFSVPESPSQIFQKN